MARALANYSEEELLGLIRGADHVNYYVADWQAELDRRANERQNSALRRIAYIATGAAIVSAAAAIIAIALR